MTLMAQEVEEKETFFRHKIIGSITHTFIPTAINESGDKSLLTFPSWGLDYNYSFNVKWGIGIHSDIVIQNFEYHNADVIRERKKPVSLVLVGTRTFGKHLTLYGGPGIEISSGEETLKLIRLGIEYGWEFNRSWEVSLGVLNDFKIDAYNATVIGVNIGKCLK